MAEVERGKDESSSSFNELHHSISQQINSIYILLINMNFLFVYERQNERNSATTRLCIMQHVLLDVCM